MKKVGWRQIVLVLAFVASLGVAVIFVVRTVQPIVFWHLHRDEPIKPWMTVGYIAHSYHVPPHVLYQALGLPPRAHDRRPLREIAKGVK